MVSDTKLCFNRTMNRLIRTSLLLVCVALGPATLAAEPLSERVRQIIAEQGVEGGQQEIPALFAAAMGDVEADETGMLALADEYIEASEFEAALFVLQLQAGLTNSPNVTVKMGDVYLAQGVAPLAMALYQQALQADPGNDYARQQLAAASKQSSAYGMLMPPPPPPKPVKKAPKESPLIIVPNGPRGGSGRTTRT